MNVTEAAKLLAFAAAFEPNLTVTREVAAVWAEVLDDINLNDGTLALKAHYRESRYPLKPADIVQGVEALHRQRVRDVGIAPDPPDDLEPGAYHWWLKEFWRRVKAGDGREAAKTRADIESGGTRRELGPATTHTISELVQPRPQPAREETWDDE